MRFSTKEIPQADRLDEVVRAIDAVAQGARTDRDIALAFGKDPRQGRYYRHAGELLGLLQNSHNQAVLTSDGRKFVDRPQERTPLLAQAVLRLRLVQRVLPYLEAAGNDGLSRHQLAKLIEAITQQAKGKTTIPRRVSTIVGWLRQIEMVREERGKFSLRGLPTGVKVVDYEAPDEPLGPKKSALTEYTSVARKVREAKGFIQVLVDDAARERANESHQMLTDLVAAKIRGTGAIPKRNPYIDLSAVVGDDLYLFEMKSTTNLNAHSQIRRAISQLYEYRYLQEEPSAKLVVVIENPPPREKQWIVDYVIKDRKLLIAWDGDRTTLKYPAESTPDLQFLA
ncbi:MAG: DUF7226 domain-containing protein [Terriglobales bacterium]